MQMRQTTTLLGQIGMYMEYHGVSWSTDTVTNQGHLALVSKVSWPIKHSVVLAARQPSHSSRWLGIL